MSDFGLAELQARYLEREKRELEEVYARKRKVCPKCGWIGVTGLTLCWNYRKTGDPTPCLDNNGVQQKLDDAE